MIELIVLKLCGKLYIGMSNIQCKSGQELCNTLVFIVYTCGCSIKISNLTVVLG